MQMKVSVQITNGIESLFGTRDENIRLLESGLKVRTRLANESIEIEGEDTSVLRAESILADYAALIREGLEKAAGNVVFYRIAQRCE